MGVRWECNVSTVGVQWEYGEVRENTKGVRESRFFSLDLYTQEKIPCLFLGVILRK
jgi:hypothetical protein